jgi:steroid 5-alpha reductase family enzyme
VLVERASTRRVVCRRSACSIAGTDSVWWGLYLAGCGTWAGAAMILSPVVMTALLAKGTGKPLLEKDIVQRRPGYADYVARTSGFVPLPPRTR